MSITTAENPNVNIKGFLKYLLVLWSKWIAIITLSVCVFAAFIFLLGARINYTESYPIGLYWTVDKSPEKGDLVHFCPSDTPFFQESRKREYIAYGYCEGNFGELMKRITALEGDNIVVTKDFVSVNGVKIPNTAHVATDKHGREMGSYRTDGYTLKSNEVLFISEYNGASFDARYFGVLSLNQIQNVVKPILTE